MTGIVVIPLLRDGVSFWVSFAELLVEGWKKGWNRHAGAVTMQLKVRKYWPISTFNPLYLVSVLSPFKNLRPLGLIVIPYFYVKLSLLTNISHSTNLHHRRDISTSCNCFPLHA